MVCEFEEAVATLADPQNDRRRDCAVRGVCRLQGRRRLICRTIGCCSDSKLHRAGECFAGRTDRGVLVRRY